MILLFNLNQLETQAENNSRKFLQLFGQVVTGPKSLLAPKTRKILAGTNFILNPVPLLTSTVDPNFVIQYIKLAGMRDYALYKLFGSKSLPLSYFPDVDLNKLKNNTLLHITATDINFKYER